MTDNPTPELQSSGAPSAPRSWLWLAAAMLLALVVQLPTLQLGFVGDDFEWWLESVRRLLEPSRLADPFGGLRLTNPLLLIPDHLLWGTWTPGWHLTNLAIHGVVMLLLFRLAIRLGLRPLVSGALVAVWAISPYTAFQVREIHPRHDPLLMACWLGIGLLWPGPESRWTARRAAAAVALALVSALTKETWVVLPGFAMAYEIGLRRRDAWAAVRASIPWAVGPVLYVALYLVRPPVAAAYAAGYWGGGPAAAAKIASTLATFCGLAELDTSSVRFGPAEWVATVLLLAVAVIAWRTRSSLLVVGLAIYLLPFVPVIPVGFMIGRYAYTPFAGFLLLGAGLAVLAARRASSMRGRRTVAAVTAVAAVAIGVSGLSVMAGELADADRRDRAHHRLVAEARRFLEELPMDRPLVCVRLERVSLNAEVLSATEGLPKAYFERSNYPYGLVRWAELFSWVAAPAAGQLWEEVRAEEVGAVPFAAIGHADGRFVVLPTQASDAAQTVAEWRGRGFPVRVIWPLRSR